MLRVPIAMAQPGLELAVPVRHPRRPSHLLLQAGFTLDAPAIARLAELKIPCVWARYPGLEFIGRHINPAIFECQSRIGSALSDLFDRVSTKSVAHVDYNAYQTLIRDFLDKLLEQPSAAMFIQELDEQNRPLLRHSADVCFLALLMGLKLDGYLVQQRRRLPPQYAKSAVNLGVGALLHDVGMLKLDDDVLRRWRATRDESDPEFQAHVRHGFEMVQGSIEPSAAASVLHHHQRFDGSGFPKRRNERHDMVGLAGERIHVFARVIAAADIFDRLRRPPDTNAQRSVVEALWRLQTPEWAPRIDPVVFRALLAVAPPYPPGAIVTLSDGVTGVVGSWTPHDPCRPVVHATGDLRKRRRRVNVENAQKIDLRERADLYVAIAEDQDVSPFNFESPWVRADAAPDLSNGLAA